jgi:hypothetical protein
MDWNFPGLVHITTVIKSVPNKLSQLSKILIKWSQLYEKLYHMDASH